MHAKGRLRGKVIRYIKNPHSLFFNRPEPVSELRAIKGQHHNDALGNRKPDLPDHTIPKPKSTRKN